jgi:hypothetical protein
MRELLDVGRGCGEGGQVEAYKLPRGKNNFELCGFLSFSSGTTGLPKAVCVIVLRISLDPVPCLPPSISIFLTYTRTS